MLYKLVTTRIRPTTLLPTGKETETVIKAKRLRVCTNKVVQVLQSSTRSLRSFASREFLQSSCCRKEGGSPDTRCEELDVLDDSTHTLLEGTQLGSDSLTVGLISLTCTLLMQSWLGLALPASQTPFWLS